jgi:hypothetical protein
MCTCTYYPDAFLTRISSPLAFEMKSYLLGVQLAFVLLTSIEHEPTCNPTTPRSYCKSGNGSCGTWMLVPDFTCSPCEIVSPPLPPVTNSGTSLGKPSEHVRYTPRESCRPTVAPQLGEILSSVCWRVRLPGRSRAPQPRLPRDKYQGVGR